MGLDSSTVQTDVASQMAVPRGSATPAPSPGKASVFVAGAAATQGFSGTDWDGDYLDDGFETILAQKFFPVMNMHCGTYRGTPNGSLGQFYGSGIGYAKSGKLPFTAHIYYDSLLSPCNISGRCIEVRYGLPYNWDLGDDQFGGAHSGDTEHISVLIQTDSAWGTASNTPDVWRIHKYYYSAHSCVSGDSSTFRRSTISGGPSDYVAEGKNSNYVTTSACDDGGVAGADNCYSAPRCWVNRAFAIGRLQNVWEFGNPNIGPFPGFIPRSRYSSGYDGISGDQYIPRPGFTSTTSPGTPYNVWGSDNFGGTGGAGTWCRHLTRFLDWYYETQSCSAHPNCP